MNKVQTLGGSRCDTAWSETRRIETIRNVKLTQNKPIRHIVKSARLLLDPKQ